MLQNLIWTFLSPVSGSELLHSQPDDGSSTETAIEAANRALFQKGNVD
jgi:hypothetical protein